MSQLSTATVTIAFNDPQLDLEEKEQEVQRLLKQMKHLKEVESVERVLDPNPPSGNKSFSAFLVGLLTAEVSPANIKKLFQFLTDRLGNKSIKMKVKASDGKEIEIEASSREEFEVAMQKAQDFLRI